MSDERQTSRHSRRAALQVLLHAVIWLALLLSPLFFVGNDEEHGDDAIAFLVNGAMPLALMVALFYANYFVLVPRLFMRRGYRRRFVLVNVALITVFAIATHCWLEQAGRWNDPPRPSPPVARPPVAPPPGAADDSRHEPPGLPPIPAATDKLFLLLRDAFNLCLVTTVATCLVVGRRWEEADSARRKAEAARAEAELHNLRNQVSPHFLLNTLNNIYALTAIDSSRAQTAIHELSALLRHALYDARQSYVALNDEIRFMRSYIDLMQLRMSGDVTVTATFDVAEHNDYTIAPLLFISLVENAFKHGVSPVGHSFITIAVSTDGDSITCHIENSNHPKDNSDNSGHGIGLANVEQRLRLAYPGSYRWHHGPSADGTTYVSHLTLLTTPTANHLQP